MIRYVLALLAINIYSCSLGASLGHNSLKDSLDHLSSRCANSYLSQQIKVKIKDCDVAVPPYDVKQVQCLMFYDMSLNMCSVLNSTFDFNETDLKAEQNLVQLCNGTNVWQFRNINLYPEYRAEVENIRYNHIACYRICSEDDYTSLDSNFFCKYYKWGSDILRSLETSTNSQNRLAETDFKTHDLKTVTILSPTAEVSKTSSENDKHVQDSILLPTFPKQNMSKSFDNFTSNTQKISPVTQLNDSMSNTTKQPLLLDSGKLPLENNIQGPLEDQKLTSSNLHKLLPTGAHLNKTGKIVSSGVYTKPEHTEEISTNLELKADTEKKLLINVDKEASKQQLDPVNSQLKLGNTTQKLSTVYSPSLGQEFREKQKPPPEDLNFNDMDYSQGEEPNVQAQHDFEQDSDGDGDIEPQVIADQHNTNSETKIEQPFLSSYGYNSQKNPDGDAENELKINQEQLHPNAETKMKAPFSSYNDDISQKDFAAQPEEDIAEDDDHFFPFFLTVIILVILLYVFYHNKNRVLGLIFEGRQSNRRRNSRGHAYRRLDTLEQAMSGGKTATPPSKIIY